MGYRKSSRLTHVMKAAERYQRKMKTEQTTGTQETKRLEIEVDLKFNVEILIFLRAGEMQQDIQRHHRRKFT